MRAALGAGAVILVFGGCEGVLERERPRLDDVTPRFLCNDAGDQGGAELSLRGAGFSPLPVGFPRSPSLVLPSVSLRHLGELDGSEGWGVVATFDGEPGGRNSERLRWRSDRELTLTFDDKAELERGWERLADGLYEVQLTAPDGSGDLLERALVVTAAPRAVGASPSIACLAPTETLRVEAPGTAVSDDAPPTIRLGEVAAPITSAGACVDVPLTGEDTRLCDSLFLALGDDALSPGRATVSVEAAPASGCGSAMGGEVEVLLVEPPVIERVTRARVCGETTAALELLVEGSGFLRVGRDPPDVFLAGERVEPWGFAGCRVEAGPGTRVEVCRSFRLTLDASLLPLGPLPLDVKSPPPVTCGASATVEVVGPPRVTGVSPAALCSDAPTTVEVHGADLWGASSVLIGGRPGHDIVVAEDGASLTATFPDGLPAGEPTIVVSDGDGCASEAVLLVVEESPRVLLVDPPVVPRDEDTDITLYVAGVAPTQPTVEAHDPAGGALALSSTWDAPGRARATVPRGLAPGTYELRAGTSGECAGVGSASLVVSADQTLALASLRPRFASSSRSTDVVVHTRAEHGVTFEPGARVLLRLSNASDAAAFAVPTGLVTNGSELVTVIPAGLSAGRYDVLVVNPSGSTGKLPGALTVAARSAPRIASVVPASLPIGASASVSVSGEGFDSDGSGMSAALDCAPLDSAAVVAPPTVVVEEAAPSRLRLAVDGAAVESEVVCALRVRNADGSEARYATLAFHASDTLLGSWAPGPPLPEPRRAPALVLVRAPRGDERVLFAIGGDDGATTSASTAVYRSVVDAFGGMSPWRPLRHTLADVYEDGRSSASPRTFAGAVVVDRFVYLLGGDDGTGPTSTLLRARVLDDRRDAPSSVEVRASAAIASAGIGAGVWSWRVSTLFPTTHPDLPGGESLPGAPVTLHVPGDREPLTVTVSWPVVPGARGYRVYRGAVTASGTSALALVGEVEGEHVTSLIDDGRATDDAVTPLVPGALGRWHVVPGATLGAARAAHATVVVPDASSAERVFLYALGGRDAAGAPLGGGERAVITVGAEGAQQVSPFSALSASLAPARAEISGLTVRYADDGTGQPATFVLVGGGTGATQVSRDLEAARVGPDGELLSFTTLPGPAPARTGAATFAARGTLLVVGGAHGSDAWAPLVAPAPGLGAWSTTPTSLAEPREHMGAASDDLFLFVVGGVASGEPASSVGRALYHGGTP